MEKQSISKASQVFRLNGGILRTSRAILLGISPRVLYEMRNSGQIRQLSRGLFQLTELEQLGNPDLVCVALRIPNAVICLISALNFYGMTSQIPHQIYIALPQSSEKPRLNYPPLDIIWLSEKSYQAGLSEALVDNIPVKIYSREKTIADCFKIPNQNRE